MIDQQIGKLESSITNNAMINKFVFFSKALKKKFFFKRAFSEMDQEFALKK